MRLWSLHPSHLDARGLVALWREGLLARKVLLGRTRGYRHHPQLLRFRAARSPVAALDGYLLHVLREARTRGYRFDGRKIRPRRAAPLRVPRGQLQHEWRHLLAKLSRRDAVRFAAQRRERPRAHPLFRVVPGGVAEWERAGRRR